MEEKDKKNSSRGPRRGIGHRWSNFAV